MWVGKRATTKILNPCLSMAVILLIVIRPVITSKTLQIAISPHE